MQLAVSLNGQQFHTLPFRWLTPPPNGSIPGLPTSSPVEGGTLVTISCPGLAVGGDYRYCFGGDRGGDRWSTGDEGATAAAVEAMGAVVAATYDAAAGTLAQPYP